MTITTERAEELAVQREYQEDYRCAEALRALAKERDDLKAENARIIASRSIETRRQMISDKAVKENEQLQQQLVARVPDGWKLVPIEPTTEMVLSGEEAWSNQLDVRLEEKYKNPQHFGQWPSERSAELCGRVAYRAMLAASPDIEQAIVSSVKKTANEVGKRQFVESVCANSSTPDSPAHRAAKVLREALEFYARMDHVEYLSGKRDWDADRKSLVKRGFRFVHEDTDGQETFVEYGEKAEEALATAKQIMEGGE